MKKLVLFFSIATCLSFSVQAQNMFKKAAGSTTSNGSDVKNLTGSIMDKLVPEPGLSDKQNPDATKAISSFLRDKSRFLPVKEMGPTGYTANQDDLFSSLKSKLEQIFLEQQMQNSLD